MPYKRTGRPHGRPVTYNAEIADKICELLRTGISLHEICQSDKFPPESTVRLWASDDREGFAAKYAHARDIGLDVVADNVIRIADGRDLEPSGDVNRDRLRFDARRWYLSKLAPKRYGDQLMQQGDVTVQVAVLLPDQATARAAPAVRVIDAGEVRK